MSRSLTAAIRQLILYDPSDFDENFEKELFTALNDLNHENTNFQLEIISFILIHFFKKLEEPIDTSTAVTLLEQGTILEHQNRDYPAAARAYTLAMGCSLPFSASAALAHASRAVVLKQLGQLQAAYDDCTIALSYDYPAHMRPLTIFLQAYLARNLSNLQAFRLHLDELNAVATAELLAEVKIYEKSEQEFLNSSEAQTSHDDNMENVQEFSNDDVVVKETALPKYRAMFANKTFESGERVFRDSAFVVLPSQGAQICSNCAACMIVPFFCNHCKGFVVYCSLKCQDEHLPVHRFECKLWACDKENFETASMLVLRMLLTGLPQIRAILASKMNSYEMWREIFENNQHDHIEYVRVLKSPSCWDLAKDSHKELKEAAMLSKFLLTYLKCATFFENWQDFRASIWELMTFTHALLIRHFGQVRIGTHVALSTLDPIIHIFTQDLNVGQLLSSKSLHVTCFYYFPFKNICNHDCTPKLEFKIQGRTLTAYALKGIGKDEEITSTYAWFDIFMPRTKFRQELLKRDFFFECQCQKCTDVEEDVEFYTICCLNQNCDAGVYPLKDEGANFKCPFCKTNAFFNLAEEKELLSTMSHTVSNRVRMFRRLNKIEKLFFHLSALKADIYQHVLRQCVISHFDREPLLKYEIHGLKSLAEYAIRVFKEMKACSVVKMRLMVPYMELLAIQEGEPTSADLEECISCIQEQPEAEQNVYMRYFEKFIKSRINVSDAE